VRVDRRHVRVEVLIWQLVVAFPDSRFAIVVARTEDVKRLSQQYGYHPSPARRVVIPKPAGGTRTLYIRNLICRVVEKSLNDAIAPYWEAQFLGCSYGFRRARSTWDLLLDMESRIASHGLYYFVQDDIRKAFDNTDVDPVMEAHRAYIADSELLAFIEQVLRGNRRRVEGLETGSPYSPTALNVLLHHGLDVPFRNQFSSTLLYRYADNLPLIGSSISRCRDALAAIRTLLLDLGLTLKGDSEGIVDLRQYPVDLLGYQIKWNENGLSFALSASAWESLDQALTKAHTVENPQACAEGVVEGWLYAAAPVLEGLVCQVLDRLCGLLCRNGLDIGDSELELLVQKVIDAWKEYRNGLLGRRGCSPAAPPAGTHLCEDQWSEQ
jgi:hypothetical protein